MKFAERQELGAERPHAEDGRNQTSGCETTINTVTDIFFWLLLTHIEAGQSGTYLVLDKDGWFEAGMVKSLMELWC